MTNIVSQTVLILGTFPRGAFHMDNIFGNAAPKTILTKIRRTSIY